MKPDVQVTTDAILAIGNFQTRPLILEVNDEESRILRYDGKLGEKHTYWDDDVCFLAEEVRMDGGERIWAKLCRQQNEVEDGVRDSQLWKSDEYEVEGGVYRVEIVHHYDPGVTVGESPSPRAPDCRLQSIDAERLWGWMD